MNKIKLLMPILGITAIGATAIPLASCSSKSKEESHNLVWISSGTTGFYAIEGSTSTTKKTVAFRTNKVYVFTVELDGTHDNATKFSLDYSGKIDMKTSVIGDDISLKYGGQEKNPPQLMAPVYDEQTKITSCAFDFEEEYNQGQWIIKFTYCGPDNIGWAPYVSTATAQS